MDALNIINKIKDADLLGKGGAGFPVGLKWEMVAKAKADKKYIICNLSEGEPEVYKDGFILKNYPEEIINGIKIALKTIGKTTKQIQAYIYINPQYYQKYKNKLEKIITNLPIILFKKPKNYLAGEETTILNVIEGKRAEPRIRPPFPTEVGLFGYPTLINNAESFFWVSKIAQDKYRGNRFYSISQEGNPRGVYELPENWSIERILKKTGNFPDFDFFVQAGGGASGEILLPKELNQPLKGLGAMVIYNRKKTNPFSLMEKWADFFLKANCDKCVPCREGVFRLAKIIKSKELDRSLLEDIFFVMEKTSFCPLGRTIPVPFKTLIDKLI